MGDNASKSRGLESGSDTSSMNTPISCIVCKQDSCKRFWCSYNRYCSLVVFGFILFIYLVIGASIFTALERPNELRSIEERQQSQAEAVDNIIQYLVNNTNMTEAEAMNETVLMFSLGVAVCASLPTPQIWDFSSAFFFVSTVVTTIGKLL